MFLVVTKAWVADGGIREPVHPRCVFMNTNDHLHCLPLAEVDAVLFCLQRSNIKVVE